MKRKETKTAQILLRIQPSVKALAEKAAGADNRSLSAFFEKLLLDHLRKHSYLKD